METIDIVFSILTIVAGLYIVWDTYQDRNTK